MDSGYQTQVIRTGSKPLYPPEPSLWIQGWLFLKQRFASSRSLLDSCCSYRPGFSSTYGRCLVPLGVWKEVG